MPFITMIILFILFKWKYINHTIYKVLLFLIATVIAITTIIITY